MTDYYIGLVVGGLIGYGLTLFTMLLMWSLCVVSKRADGNNENRNYGKGKDSADSLRRN
jgi:hypothetical protein